MHSVLVARPPVNPAVGRPIPEYFRVHHCPLLHKFWESFRRGENGQEASFFVCKTTDMTQNAPFAGCHNHNTEATVAGLRNMAERLAKGLWLSPSDVQRVVYGNCCDVVTYEEVVGWVHERNALNLKR